MQYSLRRIFGVFFVMIELQFLWFSVKGEAYFWLGLQKTLFLPSIP